MPNDDRDRCTRTTKSGTACRSYRVQWWECEGDPAPACLHHLTDEERRRFTIGRAAWSDQGNTDDLEPACWSWTMWTPEDLERYKQSFSPAVRARINDDGWKAGMMSRWHAGRCAICGSTPGHLIEDHDHYTGLVRGRLCRSCNTREGMNRVGGIWAKYRERNPASICGVRERYFGAFWDDDFEPEPPRDKWKDNAMRNVGL